MTWAAPDARPPTFCYMTYKMDRVAKPGDPDLDFDVDGVTITAVIQFGHEFIIQAEGGFGWFRATDGTLVEAEPGDPVAEVNEIEMFVSFPSAQTDPDGRSVLTELAGILEAWRDKSTPLRICSAPGKVTSVIEDVEHWVYLPRGAGRPSQGA